MGDLSGIGRMFVLAGLVLAAIGGLLLLAQRAPGFRLFRMPGDIHIERDGISIYIPIATMVLISLIATGLFWLLGWLRK